MQGMRRKLMPGVWLTYLQSKKFKTNVISIQLATPLTAEHASLNAILPAVLRRGTARYPDIQQFSAALDNLYGARIDCTIRKKGETQCIGFVASCIDDRFAPDGEHLLEKVADMMGDLLCSPATRNGRFILDYVEGEKTNLLDDIRSQINDKRSYAALRLLQEMCDGEPYSIYRLGNEREAEKITTAKLHTHYRTLLEAADVEVFYCGSAELSRVEQALLSALSTLPRRGSIEIAECLPHQRTQQVRRVVEEMDVTQGKLSFGFSSVSTDYPALLLFNSIYGGSANSKLFLNVREKLSLCYYASSVLHRQKNLITVSSGVEFENEQRALEECLSQMAAAQRGEIEAWEIEGAKSTMCSALRAMEDSMGQMEDFYLGQAVTGTDDTPESMEKDLSSVTRERMLEAAAGIQLDTVYFMKNMTQEGSAKQ